MASYAIIEASGKQFWIEEKRFYDFDKLPLAKGDKFLLNKILLVNINNNLTIGQPYLKEDFVIGATVLQHLLGKKVSVYKMRPKKKTRRSFGHKVKLTRVFINSISSNIKKASCFIG